MKPFDSVQKESRFGYKYYQQNVFTNHAFNIYV